MTEEQTIATVIDALAPAIREHVRAAVNRVIGRMTAERASLNQQIAALEERIAALERGHG